MNGKAERDYKMDNIKALLIALVVLGHVLELNLSHGGNRWFYFVIYTFHMPAFVYVSGCFASFKGKKLLLKIVAPYLIFQLVYLLFARVVLGEELKLQFTKPYWLMWYLFAMAVWTMTLPAVDLLKGKSRYALLAVTVFLAIAVGFFNPIERTLSLSRILVFYPFFLAGHYGSIWHSESIRHAESSRNMRNVLLILAALLTASIFVAAAVKADTLKIAWLYEAVSYETARMSIWYRILHLLVAGSVLLLLLRVVPNQNFRWITGLGQNTMPIYLMHGFIIKWMSKYQILEDVPHPFILSFVVFLVLICGIQGLVLAFRQMIWFQRL